MIQKDNYLTALNVAQDLAARKINLTARPSTVLGELLDLSASCSTMKTTMPVTLTGNPSPNNQMLIRSPEDRAMDVECNTSIYNNDSQHDLKLQAMADDIAPFVTSHISFARNVVAPLVGDFSGKILKFLEVARPLDPVSQFNIRQRDIPEILQDESFLSSGLSNYQPKVPEWINFPRNLEVPDDEAYYQNLVNVGNDRQNALIAKWLAPLGAGFVKAVYCRSFSDMECRDDYTPKPGGSELQSLFMLNDPGKYSNPYDSMDHALAVYLIATRLIVEVQSVKGMSLLKYKEEMRAVIDYAGSIVMSGLAAAKRQVEGQVLVSEAVLSKKQITVNKPIYQAWLAAGGCPEVLLGMLVSGQVQYSVTGVDEVKDKLTRSWQNYVMLAQADIKGELRKRFASFVQAEALLSLDEQSETEKEYFVGKAGLKDKIAAKIIAELNCLGDAAIDNVYDTALRLVAKCRFFYTSAYQILREMEEVAKTNPGIDPREASLLSAITYLALYFDEQIEVVQ